MYVGYSHLKAHLRNPYRAMSHLQPLLDIFEGEFVSYYKTGIGIFHSPRKVIIPYRSPSEGRTRKV